MSKKQELWGYAKSIFSLPDIKLEGVGDIIGSANFNEILHALNKKIKELEEDLKRIFKDATNVKDTLGSSLIREEIIVSGSRTELALKNLYQLKTFLQELRTLTKKRKLVLPEFRSVTHFKVGDEIMIYVGVNRADKRCIAKHDWISAKMLCPGWDWIMHCHSNHQWTTDGGNGGHYFRTDNQNMLFKRKDFFDLRNMLKNDPDNSLLTLLPKGIAKNISKGSVEPTTDQEIIDQRASVILEAASIIDFYAQNVAPMAKRYKIKLPSKK